ncbi:MATE family efflux transporter [Bradyrhizobium betae]
MKDTSMPATKPLWTSFLRFLAPLMLSNALQSLFGTVSNVYLGQMLGVDALAAVSVFFPVMFFLFAFVMGLSTGATVLIGQALARESTTRSRASWVRRLRSACCCLFRSR